MLCKAVGCAESVDGELEALVVYPVPPTAPTSRARRRRTVTAQRTIARPCASRRWRAASAPTDTSIAACAWRRCKRRRRPGARGRRSRARIEGGDEVVGNGAPQHVFSPEDGEYPLGLTRDTRASVSHAAAYVLYDERFVPCMGLLESLRENEDLEVRRVA